MDISANSRRAAGVLPGLADLWERRLSGGWEPPPGSPFPWAQVRLSLAALLPGMRDARDWLGRAADPIPPADSNGGALGETVGGRHGARSHVGSPLVRAAGGLPSVALVLAGNTPLLSWSPLCACLLAGVEHIRVKMSTAETLWPHLFVESLAEVDEETAARIELNVWPGEDLRTAELLRGIDAVIAYGSDTTLEALRAQTPDGVPFFGFGHAVSVALLDHHDVLRYKHASLGGLARDVLMFAQQGCLSPHMAYGMGFRGGVEMDAVSGYLDMLLATAARELDVAPVQEPATAGAIRNARDLALFAGHEVRGDDNLRWTVILSRKPLAYPGPVTRGVVYVSPVSDTEQFAEVLAPVHGRLSSVASRRDLNEAWREVAMGAGATLFCKPGEMQTPPLDWPNGGVDLLAELMRVRAAGVPCPM